MCRVDQAKTRAGEAVGAAAPRVGTAPRSPAWDWTPFAGVASGWTTQIISHSAASTTRVRPRPPPKAVQGRGVAAHRGEAGPGPRPHRPDADPVAFHLSTRECAFPHVGRRKAEACGRGRPAHAAWLRDWSAKHIASRTRGCRVHVSAAPAGRVSETLGDCPRLLSAHPFIRPVSVHQAAPVCQAPGTQRTSRAPPCWYGREQGRRVLTRQRRASL